MIERISGLLDESAVEGVRENTVGSVHFPWYFHPGTIPPQDDWDDNPQFTHLFVREGIPNSEFADKVLQLLDWPRVLSRIGPDFKILRMKANLMQNYRGNVKQHPPHVDSEEPHTVMLYYILDSDGDTVFYDRRLGDTVDDSIKVIRRERPKAGDLVLFDGSIYHSSSPPVDSKLRAVINFNLIRA